MALLKKSSTGWFFMVLGIIFFLILLYEIIFNGGSVDKYALQWVIISSVFFLIGYVKNKWR